MNHRHISSPSGCFPFPQVEAELPLSSRGALDKCGGGRQFFLGFLVPRGMFGPFAKGRSEVVCSGFIGGLIYSRGFRSGFVALFCVCGLGMLIRARLARSKKPSSATLGGLVLFLGPTANETCSQLPCIGVMGGIHGQRLPSQSQAGEDGGL